MNMKKIRKYIVIDVGAACGKLTKKWDQKLKGKCVFYCIEPLPASFEKLKSIECNNIRIFNLAINETEGIQPFYVSKYANASSLLPIVLNNAKLWKQPKGSEHIDFTDTEKIQVQVKRLDSFLRENELNDSIIDFIKIDTQGNDFNVVKSLGDMINNVKEIMLEVQVVPFEYYKGQSNKNDIIAYMTEKGFDLYRKTRQSTNQEENLWFINKKFYWFLHLI